MRSIFLGVRADVLCRYTPSPAARSPANGIISIIFMIFLCCSAAARLTLLLPPLNTAARHYVFNRNLHPHPAPPPNLPGTRRQSNGDGMSMTGATRCQGPLARKRRTFSNSHTNAHSHTNIISSTLGLMRCCVAAPTTTRNGRPRVSERRFLV